MEGVKGGHALCFSRWLIRLRRKRKVLVEVLLVKTARGRGASNPTEAKQDTCTQESWLARAFCISQGNIYRALEGLAVPPFWHTLIPCTHSIAGRSLPACPFLHFSHLPHGNIPDSPLPGRCACLRVTLYVSTDKKGSRNLLLGVCEVIPAPRCPTVGSQAVPLPSPLSL